MKKLLFLFLLLPIFGMAQIQKIENFVVKENLSRNGKLAIIAVDSAENTNERINGTYKFSINGFTQDLQFHQGIAVPDDRIESSTFVFFKHKNQGNSKARLFYIYKSDKGLSAFAISGLMFLVIPAVILLIAYAFKKLLLTAIILAIGFFFFNHSQGLNISSIIESIFASIKNLII
ncbi:hypothetical protein ACFX5U_03760 [Sphingobacterium sp. SG20118]|uniref:hypothetical protein n=1 Tax=Sphingobacterium TaxID=28453 RepID=UPI0004F63D6F|nr:MULTISPECIES: hypothetical protein [Sphingobacterium]AIM36160.1 hypothetical protein KO02_05195 [Sphingobacterium sp. ML3W]MDH5827699.1 hypothetical protein [Sphingobacterium faecium]